jgi:hypothetical protein
MLQCCKSALFPRRLWLTQPLAFKRVRRRHSEAERGIIAHRVGDADSGERCMSMQGYAYPLALSKQIAVPESNATIRRHCGCALATARTRRLQFRIFGPSKQTHLESELSQFGLD